MKKRYIVLIIIVVVLLIIRISLPFIFKSQINKQIDELEGYSGQIEGVSMQLIAGGIQIHDFTLYNEMSNDPAHAYIALDYTDVSISWRGLVKGRIVVNVILDELIVSFTQEAIDPIPLDSLLSELIPFRINLFRITNGKIGYKDITSTPEVDIYLSDFFVEATNIQNIERQNDTLPATLRIQSSVLNTGSVSLNAGINLMKEIPDFEFTLEIEKVDLTHFDPFFEAYANFNLNEGLFDLYSEAAAHEGYLNGYVKPMIENLEITPTEDDASLLEKAYETVMQGVTNILESDKTDHIGTSVEFEGRIDDPEVGVWPAVWLLLRNAFFESISPDIEDTIDFDDLT
jgi:hypothetical protein